MLRLKIIILLFIFIITPLKIYGDEKRDRVKWLDINMGLLFLPNKVFRGATFYRYPLFLPGAAINFFNEGLVIRGPEVLSTLRISKKLAFRSSLAFIFDDATLGFLGDQKDHRASRPHSLELSFGLKFTPIFPLDLMFDFSQDTISHKGQYYELGLNYAALRFMNDESPLLFISVFSSFGIGSESHNDYLYGKEASRGFNNYKVGTGFVFPDLFLKTTLINHFYYNGIIGSQNREGNLVNDRKGSFSGMVLFQKRLPL